MPRTNRFAYLPLGLALATGACSTAGEPDPGGLIEAEAESKLSDTEDTKLKLMNGQIALQHGLGNKDAQGNVNDKGVVKLSGNAKSKDEADKAASIAKNTKGVVSVKNDIQVMK